MLQSNKVTAGRYYVNNARNIARKVLEIKDNAVFFVTYHLDTGNSAGNANECVKQQFATWADREATQTEMDMLQERSIYPF